jgi:hypothetical protein
MDDKFEKLSSEPSGEKGEEKLKWDRTLVCILAVNVLSNSAYGLIAPFIPL